MLRLAARASLAALVFSAAALDARPASANGRFPAAGQIVVDPTDPSHIVVRATYGILSSRDGGQSFGWICEQAVGFGGVEDPAMAITADGTVLAGIFEGLSISHDLGCSWAFAGGDLAGHYVIDVSTERADPSRAVLVFSNGIGADTFTSQVWESADDAKTWSLAGVPLPSDFLALTVDVAPSNPDRVYVSGRFGKADAVAPYQGALMRSSDRGQTWERLDVPLSNDKALPYLAAVDPSDPDRVYVRTDADPHDVLYVSDDGGQTYAEAFGGQGSLLGFALSPDGQTILLGGDTAGVWRASAADLGFAKVSEVLVKCLHWSEGGLYACADEFSQKLTVGRSSDQGATFTPVMHLGDLCGPLACGAETSVGVECPAQWPVTKATIASTCGDPPDGGAVAASGAAATGGDSQGGGDGCGCRAGAGEPAAAWAAGLVSAALAALRRRAGRSRRTSCAPARSARPGRSAS